MLRITRLLIRGWLAASSLLMSSRRTRVVSCYDGPFVTRLREGSPDLTPKLGCEEVLSTRDLFNFTVQSYAFRWRRLLAC